MVAGLRSLRAIAASAPSWSPAGAPFRQQQQKNDIDRLTIDSIEVERLAQAHQNAERLLHLLEPRMRYRRAAAHSGRAELLALEKLGKHALRQHVNIRAGFARKLGQEFFLVGGGNADQHVVGGKKVGDFHGGRRRYDIRCGEYTILSLSRGPINQSGARNR